MCRIYTKDFAIMFLSNNIFYNVHPDYFSLVKNNINILVYDNTLI